MTMLKGVLFDLDGTLMDTAPDFYSTLDELCERYQQPRIAVPIIRETVSNGSKALTALCFPNITDHTQFEERRLELLKIYEQHVGRTAVLFPEMEVIIRELNTRSIPWGIVTNKPRLYTELLLERTQLANGCNILICADDLKRAKPDPEGILKACDALGLNPSECIYVGDHERDVIAGNAAGCHTAIVTFGYFNEQTNLLNWNANSLITSPPALLELLYTRQA